MYYFDSRIRYSEVDSEGCLTMASLLNYFQDCSTFHSEDLKLGIDYLKQQHLVWVMSAWQIVVEEFPRLCTPVRIGTAPYEFRAFMGFRNFAMMSEDGEKYYARANSIWSLLNTDTWRPVVLPREMIEKYSLSEKLDMEYASRKIPIPADGIKREPIVVRKHHLDTNHHVNNGQFVDMAMEHLPEGFSLRQMRAEYKKQALLNDVLVPCVSEQAGKVVVALDDEAGKPYAIVEFTDGRESND